MANNDSFFDLELGDNLSRHLRKFSEITDKKEAAAALDEQIIAYRDEARSVSWANAVIDLREEVMRGYTELLVFSKEKDTLTALYNEAKAYLEKLSADKINRAKAELDRLEKAKRTVAWCGKVEDLSDEIQSWTKAEQTSSGCRVRIEELLGETDGVRAADELDEAVAKLEKAKTKDDAWCDKVDALAPKFKSSYAKYATSEEAYKALQKQAVDIRRAPVVEEYRECISKIAGKAVNDTLARLFHRLDKEKSALGFALSDYIRDFDLSWRKTADKVADYENAEQAEADRLANIRKTFKQYLYEELDDGSIKIALYRGHEEAVTVPEGARYISAGAFAGNEYVTEVHLPDSLEQIGEGAFADCTSLAYVTFGAGLKTVEAEAFYGCVSLASVSLPRSVELVGDRAFAKCKKLSRFTPLSAKCKVGADYLKDTLYLARLEEEAAAEAEEALREEAHKIDEKIFSLSKMEKGKTWLRLLRQIREEVDALSSDVSVRLRSMGMLEDMEEQAERYIECSRLDDKIENAADDLRTASWCKKVKTLYDTVTKGGYECSKLPLLKRIYDECIQLEKDLKQAEIDEQNKQARLADEAATAEAKAADDKILAAKSMSRGEAWEDTLKEARGMVKNLSSAAYKKLAHLSLLTEMEAEATRLADEAKAKAKAKAKAEKAKEERKERIISFVSKTYLYLIALAIAGVGLLFMGKWLCPVLTGVGAGMLFVVATLQIDEALDYTPKSIYRTILFFLGLGGMIALCFASRNWTIFSFVFSVGFAISYIVIAAKDDYDTDFESFGVIVAVVACILTVALFLVWSLVWGFKDFVIKDGVLKDYNVRGETVVTVPGGVTVIGTGAFRDIDRIEKVILPDSVKEIQSKAFYDCSGLKKVTYGDHVVKIASDAFQNTSLDSFYIPAAITDISFLNDANPKAITVSENSEHFHMVEDALVETQTNRLIRAGSDGKIPAGITALAPYAFKLVANDAHIVINEGITTIEANVFSSVKVASITLDGSVKTVRHDAFNECTVEKLYLGASIQSIEAGALEHCWVKDLTVPFVGIISNATDGYFGDIFGKKNAIIDTYKDFAGNRIPDMLTKVTVLSGNVFKNGFREVKKVEEVVLLGAKRIEYYGFYDCNKLSRLYITSDLEYLGECLFLTGKDTVLTISYEGTEADWAEVETYKPESALNFKWNWGREIHMSYQQERPNND